MYDTWLGIQAQLGDDVIGQAHTAAYRPLHAVLIHHLIDAIGIGFGLDIPVGLSTCRKIEIETMPLQQMGLQVKGHTDIMEFLMALYLMVGHQGGKGGTQLGINQT